MSALLDTVQPGHFHRLGIAARPDDGVSGWLRTVLGAQPAVGGSRQVSGLPMHPPAEPVLAESGARSELLWLADMPIALFTATSDDGLMGRYLARHGTGLHSVAWTVQDLWVTETLLRRKDIRITGVDVPGRHFFLHPADTGRLLIEWTDTEFDHDPRDGKPLDPAPESVVSVSGVAWLTVVARDAEAAARHLSSFMQAEVIRDDRVPDPRHTTTVDLKAGDIVLRLVSPRGPDSPYADVLERVGERLYATALEVPDLPETLKTLTQEGIEVVRQDGDVAWSEPRSTLGLPFEWVAAPK
jgi:hypothetical protein